MDSGLGCLYRNADAVAKDKYQPLVRHASRRLSCFAHKKKIFLQVSHKQKNIEVYTSFHYGIQHGFFRSVGKSYTYQNYYFS